MNDIDYIIPMVFPDDKEWEQDLRRAGGRRPAKAVRFRSWGTERLLVQCVRRNLPFVRDIIILLARDSQVQPWMETEDVRVVTHAEFIPKKHLPTFNSCTIEMYLHRIPGLSDMFLYSNDDLFPLSPLRESDQNMPSCPFSNTSFKLPSGEASDSRRVALCAPAAQKAANSNGMIYLM